MLCHVGPLGTYTSAVKDVVGEEAGRRLVGKAVLSDGGKEIVKILEEMGEGGNGKVLVKRQRIKHRYPYDWKTKEPIIVTLVSPPSLIAYSVLALLNSGLFFCSATSQWFANLDTIKEDALEALRKVNFFPSVCKSFLLPASCSPMLTPGRFSAQPSRLLHRLPLRMVYLPSTRLGRPHPLTPSRPDS